MANPKEGGGGGVGVLCSPYNDLIYARRLRLRGVNVFELQADERVRISPVEVYQDVRKSVISVCKKTPKRITNPFYGFASVLKKSSSGIKDSAFIAVKRGAKF